MDEYYHAIRSLPGWLAQPLQRVPPEIAAGIHEIRLRDGRPVGYTAAGTPADGARLFPQDPALRALAVPSGRLEEVLFALCGGSVHSYEQDLARGFFTLPGGHRVGVGGQYGCGPGGVPVLRRAESLNLRVARYGMTPVPQTLRACLRGHFTGILIVGEPDSGKTTILRSLLPELAAAGRTVSVIDERGELLPERFCADGAATCDRIAGLPKALAVEMALRALGPQVILLDELGDLRETQLLEQGFFSGVDFVATLHAASFAEAERRPQVRYLLARGMLRRAFLLAGRSTPGRFLAEKEYG